MEEVICTNKYNPELFMPKKNFNHNLYDIGEQ